MALGETALKAWVFVAVETEAHVRETLYRVSAYEATLRYLH